MKMINIMKRSIKNIVRGAGRTLLLCAIIPVLAMTTSCVRENLESPDVKDGEALVTLSLNVPAATRALTGPQEDAVDNIWVLAFKTQSDGGTYSYMAKGTANGASQYTVTLRTGTWDLVVLANAGSIIAGNSSLFLTSKSKSDVLDGLTLSNDGKWNVTPLNAGYVSIPMSSDPACLMGTEITEETTTIAGGGDQGKVDLYRMLARVNVALTSKGGVNAKDNFSLESIRFYNRNTKGYLKPDRSGTVVLPEDDPAKVNAFLSRPQNPSTDFLEYKGAEITLENDKGISCANEIYVFEVDNHADDLDLLTRPCLVIGGIYKGVLNYYRVDFSKLNEATSKDEYLDILRNHSYNIYIEAVNGPGFIDPDDAFKSLPVNMTVKIVPWDDKNILIGVTDGQYDLGVNRKEFTFSKEGITGITGDNKLIVSTTYTGAWTVTVKNDDPGKTDATYSSGAKWLTLIQSEGGTQRYSIETTSTEQQSFYFDVESNDTGTERTAYIYITAGRITQEIKVTQNTNSAQTLEVSTTSLSFPYGVSSLPFTVTSNTSWSVSSNQSWCIVSPASGSNNGSISVLATANSSNDERTATITIRTTDGSNITKIVSVAQDFYPPSFPAFPGVIGIDSDGKLNLDGRGDMMYFKFGSVVGVSCDDKTTSVSWSSAHLRFNPMTDQSAITGYGNTNSTLPNIPGYVNATDGNVGVEGFISKPEYHNGANVSLGKGDPCKLVGLTAAEVRAKVADGTISTYKSGWRLPTTGENVDFVGAPTSYYTSTSYINQSTTNFNYWGDAATDGQVAGRNGGWFPVPGNRATTTGRGIRSTVAAGFPDAGFLPAAGYRIATGPTTNVGAYGCYWSGTVLSTSSGYTLYFYYSSVYPRYSYVYATGAAVRCVPQE